MTTTAIPVPTITEEQKHQYQEEGYFLLEKVIPEEHLELLREKCAKFMEIQDRKMDAEGVDRLGINHRNKRYFVGKAYEQDPELGEFLFSSLMAEICKATVGPEAGLFVNQFVVKGADPETKFSWHQDSGYVGIDCPMYNTCWITLDDVNEENGTVYILPYSRSGIRSVVNHVRHPETNDMVGYFGSDPGMPIILPAGSIAVFSSYVFHRSGGNMTDALRRVYVAQYSSEEIVRKNGEPFQSFIPFLKDGENVTG